MNWLKQLLKPRTRVQPVAIDDSNFDREVLRSDLPVMVDVWSDGCAPCKQLEPIVMDIARDYQGRLKVVELHGARAPHTLARLGVRGTPTVLYFDQGQEVERIVGFRGSLYHREFLDHELLTEPVASAT
ncbi:MAG: thioredoxin domain-containing protein [Pseudomonadota bacterium]